MFLSALFLASLAPLAHVANARALPQGASTSASSISWSPCTFDFGVEEAFECARLPVPLDYLNVKGGGAIELDLLRSASRTEPFLGSILLNPGGPGASGVEFTAQSAEMLHTVLGGQYDLIGFDPRGTGRTLPPLCNKTLEALFLESAQPRRKRDDTGLDLNFLTTAAPVDVQETWDYFVDNAELCATEDADIGQFLGTTYVARDMLEIVDALGEDGMLRYWGFSYGTVLGATFAAMFPDRVDRMVIDGVSNIHEYWSGETIESGASTDATYNGFISYCISHPKRCALAADFDSEKDLKAAINDLINLLDAKPLTQKFDTGSVTMQGSTLRGVIFNFLYHPNLWVELAQAIAEVMAGDLTSFAPASKSQLPIDLEAWSVPIDYSLPAIRCSDSLLRVGNWTEMLELGKVQGSITAFAKEVYIGSWMCAAWGMWAREVGGELFANGAVTATASPVMLVGTTFDPITPLVSAYNLSASFEGSVVLEHNGYGHTSLSHPNVCTARAVRKYFAAGTLPAEGTVCEPDYEPFDAIETAMQTTAAAVKRGDVYTDDDLELLAAMSSIGKILHGTR